MNSASSSDKIVFLFGAGVSIPAGMPSTAEITNRILSGKGVMRHSDCNYYFGKPHYEHMGWPDEYVPTVQKIIQLLKDEIEQLSSNRNNGSVNYEDIFYLTSQIHDKVSGEFDNPAMQPLIDEIEPKVMSIIKESNSLPESSKNMFEIFSEVKKYLLCLVWQILLRKSKICIPPIGGDFISKIKIATTSTLVYLSYVYYDVKNTKTKNYNFTTNKSAKNPVLAKRTHLCCNRMEAYWL